MKENRTDNKLGTELGHNEISHSRTQKFKLKFTDFAVEKYVASFFINGKVKARKYVPFDVSRHTILKGLKLCIQKSTGSKLFWLQFWFNGKADYYSVGKRIPGSWGVNEVEDKLLPIVRSHTNDKGHWIKSPVESEKKKALEDQRLVEDHQTY